MSNIKQEIDANIRTNGQQLISGSVLNGVLKDMVDDSDGKVSQLALKLDEFGTLVASLFEDVVFTRDRSADVARLKAMFGGRAICGQCICGQVICGN